MNVLIFDVFTCFETEVSSSKEDGCIYKYGRICITCWLYYTGVLISP